MYQGTIFQQQGVCGILGYVMYRTSDDDRKAEGRWSILPYEDRP